MIMGIVFKDGKEIDRGICTGSKRFAPDYPEQSITICSDTDIMDERTYSHGNGISFQELQDNGNGWEVVYDSNEKIDRTVEYPLPGWLFKHEEPIPDYRHKIEGKEIESTFKGYIY